jgi:hypothetical protein
VGEPNRQSDGEKNELRIWHEDQCACAASEKNGAAARAGSVSGARGQKRDEQDRSFTMNPPRRHRSTKRAERFMSRASPPDQ